MPDFTTTYSQGSSDTWKNAAPGSIVVAYNPFQPELIARTDDGHGGRTEEHEQVEVFGTHIREVVQATRMLFKK